MPTKLNHGGHQQPYVPEGNGDASGEYTDNESGSNKHYTNPDDIKKKLGYQGESEEPRQTTLLGKKLNGEKITDDMKSERYMRENFTETTIVQGNFSDVTLYADVHITRGSLTDDEIGIMNSLLQELYDTYPDMQKFTKIDVKNAKKSGTGGYVKTWGSVKGKQAFDLYINAGWLDSTDNERAIERNLKFYEEQIKKLEDGTLKYENEDPAISLKNYRQAYNDLVTLKNRPYNTIHKMNGRENRLKAIIDHELMHRIYDLNVNSAEFEREIGNVYKKAIDNGDAKKISVYASTNQQEFISEAYSQIRAGIETPDYIVDIVEKVLKGGK